MRIKFKIILLFPILFSAVSCSKSDKITFQCVGLKFDTYYNDSYFLLDNREPHEEIALASHAMALATFSGDEDYSKRSLYLRDLWNEEHFDNIWMSPSFYVKPETDSIAYGVASKYISQGDQGFTLVAVAVRGGNYEGEWASNFTLGTDGNSQGFDEASDMVMEGIGEYITNYEITGKIKLWIAGYSRAAITTNMCAGKILNKLVSREYLADKIYYSSDDVYAYCFEPPMGVQTTLANARSDLYHGIHNFVNYNDPVPLVAPFEWGFTRYGTDHYYPDRINDIYFDETERKKIVSLHHFTFGAQNFADYAVDEWKFFDVGPEVAAKNNLPRESVNPSLGRFARTLINELAVRGITSRELYVDLVQEGVRELMATIMGLNPDIEKINMSNLVQVIFEYDFIKTLINELMEDQSSEFAMDVEMLFLQVFGANKDNFDTIHDLYKKNYYFFNMLSNAFSVRKDIVAQLLYRDNAMNIINTHMPEISYSFLCATDSRFYGDKKCKLNDGKYNILHIEKPTSFTLIEKNIKKDVFRYKDGVMSSKHLSAEKYADGSIDIYLPTNGEYEYISDALGIELSYVDPLEGVTYSVSDLPINGEI